MRVIAGEFRRRLLKSLPGLDVRPTPDRLREALFNVLAPRIEEVVFADLYAGTGAVGIEALSRGARRVLFVEQDRAAVGVIRANLKSLGIEGRADVRQGKTSAVLRSLDADIVFVDPPYRLDAEYESTLASLSTKPGTKPPPLVLVQHDIRRVLAENYGALRRMRVLRQGDNCVTFYSAPTDTSTPRG
jgi:16S rRNA (guanine(966)-N(2))-methyltransferase RsmD